MFSSKTSLASSGALVALVLVKIDWCRVHTGFFLHLFLGKLALLLHSQKGLQARLS